MTMTSDDAVDVACTLAPHGPANMLSTFMTRYDYDYNRDPALTGSSSGGVDGGNAFGAGMSGDVRNRPIFAHGVDTGDRDDRTTYMVDYTAKDRTVKDMARLAAACLTNGGAAAPVAGATGDPDNGTAYQRNWYRPDLSAHIARDDGSHPHTSYQDDYQARPAAAAAVSAVGEPVCYAGAAAVLYNADLLKPHNVVEDDGADLAPKITSRESLLPRKPKTANGTFSPVFVNLADHRRTWNDCRPGDGVVGSYSCTSWAYGDPSDAHPLQLPLSLARSLASHELDVAAHPDKAALLRQLAGRTGAARASSAGTPLDTCDRTNPQYLATMEQKRCAVSRRLEKEHYVSMSMYKSDFIDQNQLPELAGNHGGPADALDTRTCPLATAGEMMAGQLTRTTRELGLLRNAHGTLKAGEAPAASRVSTGVVAAMRTMEKAVAIDKADPHRHKLRA